MARLVSLHVEPMEIKPYPLDKEFKEKVNELIDAHNELVKIYQDHVHYARELQFHTGRPDDPEVFGIGRPSN